MLSQLSATPHTQALRHALSEDLAPSEVADLMFLEAWERDPAPGLAAARRVAQIRRAQPALAAAIRQQATPKR